MNRLLKYKIRISDNVFHVNLFYKTENIFLLLISFFITRNKHENHGKKYCTNFIHNILSNSGLICWHILLYDIFFNWFHRYILLLNFHIVLIIFKYFCNSQSIHDLCKCPNQSSSNHICWMVFVVLKSKLCNCNMKTVGPWLMQFNNLKFPLIFAPSIHNICLFVSRVDELNQIGSSKKELLQ